MTFSAIGVDMLLKHDKKRILKKVWHIAFHLPVYGLRDLSFWCCSRDGCAQRNCEIDSIQKVSYFSMGLCSVMQVAVPNMGVRIRGGDA